MHEIVYVSADLKHDAHLVKSFCETNLKVLNDFDIKCENVFKFTDQAPSQYKNKSAFRYLSQTKIPVICNFFGVCHDKGPCDPCTGHVKQMVSSAVKRREAVVNSPISFYEYTKTKLEKTNLDICNKSHFWQTYHYHEKLSSRLIQVNGIQQQKLGNCHLFDQ